MGSLAAVEAGRLEGVDGLLWTEGVGELAVEEHGASAAVHAEQRGARAARVDRDQR